MQLISQMIQLVLERFINFVMENVIYKTFGTGAIGIASGITTTAIQLTPDQRLVNESIYFVSKVK